MKKVAKLHLAVWVLLGSSTLGARMHHIWFDDSAFNNSWTDALEDFRDQSAEFMKAHMVNFGPSKEDREALNAARENMAKISYDIKEDDQKILISFSGFENLEKKDIKVVKKEGLWEGIITTQSGAVEFFISSHDLSVHYRVEIKKEDKKKGQFYSSSVTTRYESFKHPVDLSTVKAEPLKDNTLTMTVEKQKEEVLSIPE